MCSKVRLWHLEKYDRCQDQVLSDICPVKKKKQVYGKQPLSSGQQTKTGKQPGKPVQW